MKLLSEFAARWRRELVPESVKEGRDIAKLGVTPGAYPKYKPMFQDFVERLYTGKTPIPKKTPYLDPLIKEKIDWAKAGNEMYKSKRGINYNKYRESEKPRKGYFGSEAKEDLEKARERAKARKMNKSKSNIPDPSEVKPSNIKRSSSLVKSSVSNSKKSTLIKVLGKNKLIVGVGALGAIGSGIALNRKSRKDKGKKRGIYRK